MRSNYFWTANRIIVAGLTAVLALMVLMVLLADAVGLPQIAGLATAVVLGLALVAFVVSALAGQVTSLTEHVSRMRPGLTVLPAAALAPTRADRLELGLQRTGPHASGGSPAALVVLADRVELWSGRKEAGPRWSAARNDLVLSLGTARVGTTNWNVVNMSDDHHAVSLAPRYSRLPAHPDNDVSAMLRALRCDSSEEQSKSHER
ncbi:hypothetical protein [Isoptericola luteus]|uniref:hypothetical protein n=1 Tax=Isoptericola luteus TaxID=2879484 RepID=UPI001CE0EE68|nr:hypothetical protein [Isoptericola sp. NEAU-Y5]